MYATPFTRAGFGKLQADGTPRALLARESSWRGWGWHFLAMHHRPHGWVEQDLGGFLYNLYHQLCADGAIHLVARGEETHVLLVFPNKEAVVARCNQPKAAIVQLLDSRVRTLSNGTACRNVPGSLVFAPLLLRLSNKAPIEHKKAAFQTVAQIQTDPGTFARIEQDMADVLDVLDRLGPVKKPWDARPGDLVAPWAMGRTQNTVLELAVKGALHSLVPSLSDKVPIQIMGMTIDDNGTPKGKLYAAFDSTALNPVDFTQWDRFLVWIARLPKKEQAGIPFAHCIAQQAQGYARPGRDSKRVAAAIVRTTSHITSAHHKLEALQAYHATL